MIGFRGQKVQCGTEISKVVWQILNERGARKLRLGKETFILCKTRERGNFYSPTKKWTILICSHFQKR